MPSFVSKLNGTLAEYKLLYNTMYIKLPLSFYMKYTYFPRKEMNNCPREGTLSRFKFGLPPFDQFEFKYLFINLLASERPFIKLEKTPKITLSDVIQHFN